MTPEPERSIEIGQNDPLAAMVAELQQRLATVDLVDLMSRKSGAAANTVELMILRKGYIELRMYKESAHQRPHFHIEYKREFEASYALDNFERLAGYIPRKYEDVVLPLAQANKDQLMERWRRLNGTVRITLSEDSA